MNLRIPALICVTLAAFVACGRLDLGDYPELQPPSKDPEGMPPAATSGASNAAGQPAGNTEGGAAGRGAGPEGGAANAGEPGHGAAGDGGDSGDGGDAGAGTTAPQEKKSCRSSPAICGPNERSCCAVEYLSAGEVVRGGIKEGEPRPAASRVSAFYLGVYEVTVGRFRAFLKDYDAWRESGAPRVGDGKHPLVPGSGWRQEWFRPEGAPPDSHGLGADGATVAKEVSHCMGMPFYNSMWIQPANCVSFYEAQAFCIWDGGRLPTDLEWEYAAAGGAENRPYPWGAEPPTRDYAMYGCLVNIGDPCHTPAVGSFAVGVGRFGQLDLAGSVAEWTLDTVGPEFPIPCHDCANVEQIHADNPRSTRGGSWSSDASSLAAASTPFMPAHLHHAMHGMRCAYDAP